MLDQLQAMTLQRRTRNAYKRLFATDDGQVVLRDLAKFCGVDRPSSVPGDPFATHVNDGMRRVALRVFNFINMSDAEMMRLAQKRSVSHGEDFDDEDD